MFFADQKKRGGKRTIARYMKKPPLPLNKVKRYFPPEKTEEKWYF